MAMEEAWEDGTHGPDMAMEEAWDHGSWSWESKEKSDEDQDPCFGVSCTGHTGTSKDKGGKPKWDRKRNGPWEQRSHDDNWTNRGGRRGSAVHSCCNVIQAINFN